MDAPQPDPHPSASAQRGRELFSQVGCSLCHTPTMQTGGANGKGGPANSPVLVNRPVNLFSDLLVHHMGPVLADDIVQGAAGPDEFRSTPLWGVGQRIFFLHDGRTSDILQAILLHASGDGNNDRDDKGAGNSGTFGPSEANGVIQQFRHLGKQDQQAILDFLRSL
jgi:CxxC motif-containing protein (DUF1111 family)